MSCLYLPPEQNNRNTFNQLVNFVLDLFLVWAVCTSAWKQDCFCLSKSKPTLLQVIVVGVPWFQKVLEPLLQIQYCTVYPYLSHNEHWEDSNLQGVREHNVGFVCEASCAYAAPCPQCRSVCMCVCCTCDEGWTSPGQHYEWTRQISQRLKALLPNGGNGQALMLMWTNKRKPKWVEWTIICCGEDLPWNWACSRFASNRGFGWGGWGWRKMERERG